MKTPPIDLINSFISFVELKTLEASALTLAISQPALSVQLKRFTEYFEYPIFEFKGKKKILTPYGNEVYQDLKKSLFLFTQSFETLNRNTLLQKTKP